jgi:ribulose-5-phosphate 4-epimerase/fuculose-1-phosphate aldolase
LPNARSSCDFTGNVIAGGGKPKATALYIHAQLHKALPRAVAAFHTNMPNATALSMLEDEPVASLYLQKPTAVII